MCISARILARAALLFFCHMSQLRKFFRLSFSEQVLLVRATIVLALIRLGLWLLPFRVLKEFLSKVDGPARVASRKSDLSAEHAVWAVRVATRYVPHATCLTQALTGQLLLGFEGIPASVHIGIAREKGRAFEAHAWLDSEGKVLIGGPDSTQKYMRLLPIDPWNS